VVRPPVPLAAAPYALPAEPRLRDTLPDLPESPDALNADGQASGDSMSLIVVTGRPVAAPLILLLVLLPIALAAAALVIAWLWDLGF
jgi:hypothetical protein